MLVMLVEHPVEKNGQQVSLPFQRIGWSPGCFSCRVFAKKMPRWRSRQRQTTRRWCRNVKTSTALSKDRCERAEGMDKHELQLKLKE